MLLASSNSDFLIPNGTFIAELIMFIIVLGIVAKFILPALGGAMEERERTIKSALQASDEGKEEADRLVKEQSSVLAAARDEARSIMNEATVKNEATLEEARQRARREHDRLLAEAEPTIRAAKQEARQGVLARFDDLVASAVQHVIGEAVDISRHRQLISETIERAKARVEA